MALKDYLSSFPTKQLNEVVIPGSHDAGIFQYGSSGGGKTQSLNIAKQAEAGCRWFDIRITGQVVHGQVVHRAFHSSRDPKKKDLQHNNMQYLEPKGSISTDFGGELDSMLRDAKAFVEANGSEFVIFKISKSSNIEHIYSRCQAILGARHYVNGSNLHNLNLQPVGLLAGHVITLFSTSDCQKIALANGGNADGAFPYHELTKGKATDKGHVGYSQTNRGLQYFGKYSNTIYTGKNSKEQVKKFKGFLKSDGYAVDAMGVLYWTLTTSANPHSLVKSNINNRNVKQWDANGANKLRKAFGEMIYVSIEQKMGKRTYYPNNNDFPLYMPNVIMMDFVNDQKCQEVYQLNFVTNGVIQNLVDESQNN